MKKLLAIVLSLTLVAALFAGCGDKTASAPVSASAPEQSAPAVAEETPAASEPGSAADSAADAAPVEMAAHDVNFPGFEDAQLDYSNECSLPLSEDGAELTMLTTAVNLMGDLGNLGINNYNDFEYMQELEARTGVHVETTEVNFFTASEQYNVMLASGDYPDLLKNVALTTPRALPVRWRTKSFWT